MKLLRTILSSTWAIREDEMIAYSKLVEAYLNGNTTVFSEFVSEKQEMRISAGGGTEDVENRSGVVVVIPVDGIITKNDFCGFYGTKTIDQKIKKYLSDDTVAGIVLDIDSPGGEVSYLENLAETISNANKPILSFVSGQCCSAAYYYASNCSKIYASAKSDMIGSVGTMAGFHTPNPKSTERPIIHTIYATKSTQKNKPYEEARQGKYDLMRVELLDPVNEIFHSYVRQGRTNATEEVYTGKVWYAEDAMKQGLIDGFRDLDSVVQEVFTLNQSNMFGLFNRNRKNQNTMSQKFEKISALIGREFKDGDTLTAEDLQKLEASAGEAGEKTPPSGTTSEANNPTAELGNLVKQAVNAAVAPVLTSIQTIDKRLEVVEGKDGSQGANPNAGQAATSTEGEVEPWNDPNNPINKAVDAALGL